MSPSAQATFLRFLEEKESQGLGLSRTQLYGRLRRFELDR